MERKPPAPSIKRLMYAEIQRRMRTGTKFKVVSHTVHPDVEVVEVWIQGQFVATITPEDVPGVRIISKHIESVMMGNDNMACRIVFNPAHSVEQN